MSASPSATPVPSTKRPLDEESSATGLTDQPDAKRPALDKTVKGDEEGEKDKPEEAAAAPPAVVAEPKPESDVQTNGHTDAGGDTVVPDAPNGVGSAAVATTALETQPIQSTATAHDRSASHATAPRQGHQDETGWLHMRAVISSAEAATVIGKGGENVSQVRRLSGAKCTVSDYSRGAVERILTVSGLVDAVAKVNESKR
jgi:heterogeneous nuclear rnp K-like protein